MINEALAHLLHLELGEHDLVVRERSGPYIFLREECHVTTRSH